MRNFIIDTLDTFALLGIFSVGVYYANFTIYQWQCWMFFALVLLNRNLHKFKIK